MEELERGRVKAGDVLKTIFTDIEAGWKREISRREESFKQERQKLLDELIVLKDKAASTDALLSRNKQLREELQNTSHAVSGLIRASHTPALDEKGGVIVDHCEVVPANDEQQAAVPYEEYRRVKTKCEEAVRQVELQKQQGGEYKAGYKRMKVKYELYKEKFEHCKASIKSWQVYADATSAATKSPAKQMIRDATTPVVEGFGDSKSPPNSIRSLATPALLLFSPIPSGLSNSTEMNAAHVDVSRAEPSTEKCNSQYHASLNNSGKIAIQGVKSTTGHSTAQNNITCTDFEQHDRQFDAGSDNLCREIAYHPNSDDMLCFDNEKPNQLDRRANTSSTIKGFVSAPTMTKELPSSQTTEGELEIPATAYVIKNEQQGLEDDEPTVVSIKSVKRKRHQVSRVVTQNTPMGSGPSMNGSSHRPYTIKHEEGYSSPLGLAGIANLHPENSLDLDEVSGDIETPRKRRLRRMLSNVSKHKSVDEYSQIRATSMPLESEVLEHRLSDSFEAEISEHPLRSHEDCSSLRGSQQNFPAQQLEFYNPDIISPRPTEDIDNEHLLPKTENNILQPLSANKRIVPWTRKAPGRNSSKLRRETGPIHEITEDGEEYSPVYFKSSHTLRPQTEARNTTKLVGSRIDALLHSSSPSRQPLGPRGSNDTSKTSSAGVTNPATRTPSAKYALLPNHVITPKTTTKRNGDRLHEHDSTETRSARPCRSTRRAEQDKNQIQPEDEPLRARPVDRLNLDDFKINPQFNQGLDFAFTEVVRNQEQRRCLPGCTRPECCGDRFRRIVELGGGLPAPARGLWDSSPPEDDADDDQRLLEAYLGHDHQRLKDMTAREKMELLITAKAEQLAQKHGRHRQAFQRRATPPGFWRTDMPTTQETEADREMARQMERRKIEERYVEAKRANGRWLFKDE